MKRIKSIKNIILLGYLIIGFTSCDFLDRSVSSYMVNDASYFRCTNITLNYNLPQKWVEKIKLRGVSLFASIDNAFTITDYIGYNPDVSYKSGNLMPGFDWGTYPLSRAYNFGCKLSF